MAPSTTTNGSSAGDHAVQPIVNVLEATTTIAGLQALIKNMSPSSTGDIRVDNIMDGIRREIESLTSVQSAEQQGIKKLLEEAMNKDVLEPLTKEIESKINKCIDETIAAGLVEKELDAYIPKELRESIDTQRLEMQTLHVKIHNSEARRANSFIKTKKQFGEDLQHIIDNDGIKSDIFPKTVEELLEFGDAKVIKLVGFYGMKDPDHKSIVPNLNWFLREVGVTYQYVYRRPFRPFPP